MTTTRCQLTGGSTVTGLRSRRVSPAILDDLSELQRSVHGKPLIAIDGRMAVGKTTLAKNLAGTVHGTLIQTDWFFLSQWGRDLKSLVYSDLLDLEALEVRVRNALRLGTVIVEGICMLDTMHRLGREPDLHVLVSVMQPATARFTVGEDPAMESRDGPSGVHDAALLDDNISEGQLMTELRKDWGTLDLISERSLVAYFKRFRPHREADVVFLRT